MINRQLLHTTLEKTETLLLEYRDLIETQAHFFVFSFTLQDCINISSQKTGLKPEALNINDYTFFMKVISGDHPIVATWEESTYYINEGGKQATRYGWMQNEMGARKKYQVGRFFKGAVESDVQGLSIGSNEGAGVAMTNLQENQELSLLVTEKLEKSDIFKLWIVKRYDTLDNFAVTRFQIQI